MTILDQTIRVFFNDFRKLLYHAQKMVLLYFMAKRLDGFEELYQQATYIAPKLGIFQAYSMVCWYTTEALHPIRIRVIFQDFCQIWTQQLKKRTNLAFLPFKKRVPFPCLLVKCQFEMWTPFFNVIKTVFPKVISSPLNFQTLQTPFHGLDRRGALWSMFSHKNI